MPKQKLAIFIDASSTEDLEAVRTVLGSHLEHMYRGRVFDERPLLEVDIVPPAPEEPTIEVVAELEPEIKTEQPPTV